METLRRERERERERGDLTGSGGCCGVRNGIAENTDKSANFLDSYGAL